MTKIPRPEYPRPQFVRDTWQNLNGEWQFSFDEPSFDQRITVPFVFQSKLSGICNMERHDVVWYRKAVTIPEDWEGQKVLLHFGAVDYRAKIWINGTFIGSHTGGHVSFSFDITEALQEGENTITVCAEDDLMDMTTPRGKQYWGKAKSIFYTPSTGIWQTVWLEAVAPKYIRKVDITPDLDRRTATFDYVLSDESLAFEVEVAFKGKTIACERTLAMRKEGRIIVPLDKQLLGEDNFNTVSAWSPKHPNLFDVTYRLSDGETVCDTVKSYFGLRKISVENGIVLLNNYPLYQKLLLDQGYWPDSLLTAPDDEAFVRDIELCKAMGFNGVRKHQKVEDPRFLYYADKMGLLVWSEMANAFEYTTDYIRRFTSEWMESIERDYNHPCIIAWTPLNESWGVENISSDSRQAHHATALVELTKSLDPTRLVMSNDGWEQTTPDILGIHDYQPKKEILSKRYASLESTLQYRSAGRALFATGYSYAGQPIMNTESGGIFYNVEDTSGWGYTNAENLNHFYKLYYEVISAFLESPVLQGFCYTQLTDVMQEQNGLLTYAHNPKFDVEIIKAINEGRYTPAK
ncbi:MAG: beta galactosidase jelly roll domain-containing protein [Clostridia bacterium]|nr:beta galactosidase jelly roll domain-containing protein [Clostridia bacterium]